MPAETFLTFQDASKTLILLKIKVALVSSCLDWAAEAGVMGMARMAFALQTAGLSLPRQKYAQNFSLVSPVDPTFIFPPCASV